MRFTLLNILSFAPRQAEKCERIAFWEVGEGAARSFFRRLLTAKDAKSLIVLASRQQA